MPEGLDSTDKLFMKHSSKPYNPKLTISIYDINEINVTMGKGYKDFENGSYAASVKSHVESIAGE